MCCTPGFPGYGYLPAPTPGTAERQISAAAAAAAAAYYADYAAAAPTSHVPSAHAVSGVTRSEPSPMPLSSSPMHRDQYTQRTAAAGTTYISSYWSDGEKKICRRGKICRKGGERRVCTSCYFQIQNRGPKFRLLLSIGGPYFSLNFD